jgi:glutamyl-tRNA(Gln) amidotransferase subunit D
MNGIPRSVGSMSYSPYLLSLLQRIGAVEGDLLEVAVDGRKYSGVLMPHHEFSHPDVMILKLKNGYNVGVMVTPSADVKVVAKRESQERAPRPMGDGKGLPQVSVLGTGGTIASYVDYRTGAVHPALSAADLLSTVPEMADICDVKAEVLYSTFSENMTVENWQHLAGVAADRLNSGVEGVIVPHGTDTMGYTAAALSFMLGDIPRPVVLVGAQRSSDRPSSDAYTNLVSAARFITSSDAAEVLVLMHDSSSDVSAAVHRATKVRKMHTSRRDAFQSVNAPPVARVDFEGGIDHLAPYRRKSNVKVSPRVEMEKDVALVQFYPGMSPSMFEGILEKSRGVVIAGSGLGHVSRELIPSIRRAVEAGTMVVMTSQCLHGSVNLNVYATGRDLLSAGVVPGGDMLPETAYVKLMWVLGQTSDLEEAGRMMVTDMRGEITGRREMQ